MAKSYMPYSRYPAYSNPSSNRYSSSTGSTTSYYSSSQRFDPIKYTDSYMRRSHYMSTGTSKLPSRPLQRISSPRALPPSPIDRYATNYGADSHTFPHRTSVPRTDSRSTSRKPMRCDHSTPMTKTCSPNTSSHSTYGASGSRLNQRDRTQSYSEINRITADLRTTKITDAPEVSLRRSRKYSSSNDVGSSSSSCSSADRSRTTPNGVGTQSYDEPTDNLPSIHTPRSQCPSSMDRYSGGIGSKAGLEGGAKILPTSGSLAHPSEDYSSGNHSRMTVPDPSSRKGLVGLRNLGNTCFMNSIIQCLSNTALLRNYCHSGDVGRSPGNSSKGAIISAYANLMKMLWNTNDSSVSPNDFKSRISKFAPRFVGYNQQDAQEFLIYLLEGLHEDLNRCNKKKSRVISKQQEDEEDRLSATDKSTRVWKRYLDVDNSKIVDIFVGQLRSTLTCTVCEYKSYTFDPFWDLSLPIRKEKRSFSAGLNYSSAVSLKDCLELFTQEEILDGDEMPTCAKCKQRRKCTKRFSIEKFPRVLVLHLKRFKEGAYYRSKLSTLVEFPIRNLDLTQFAAEKNVGSTIYNLYAVSNHSGSTYGGHYTAYARHPETGQWNYFNDQRVESVPERSIQSNEAYVLFYELTESAPRL